MQRIDPASPFMIFMGAEGWTFAATTEWFVTALKAARAAEDTMRETWEVVRAQTLPAEDADVLSKLLRHDKAEIGYTVCEVGGTLDWVARPDLPEHIEKTCAALKRLAENQKDWADALNDWAEELRAAKAKGGDDKHGG